MLGRFKGRTAVVTGGGGGIGAAIALRLAAEEATVAVLDRDEEAAGRTAAAVQATRARCLPLACDVTVGDDVGATLARVADELGPVDVLVHSAGVTRDQLLFKMSEEDWDSVLNVNLKSAFLCARAAQRQMVDRRYGRLVFLSSTSARGNRGQANYAAAKAGLQGLTRTLAIELGPFGITANAVGPGYIATAMTEAAAQRMGMDVAEHRRRVAEATPLRRVGEPEDVASVVAFLASDDAAYVSGQVLYVNGGAR